MAKKPHKIHIQHHHDGSHTKTRHYKDGSSNSSAHHNLDGVHDSLQDHLGSPNPGEAAMDAGDHGIPAEHAGPAGIPAASAAAPPTAPGALPGLGA